jgi:paraquat-inducible protein A
MSDSAPVSLRHRSIPFLIAVSFALFATGIFFPFFHVTKLWIFDDAVSVVGGIITLFQEGEYFLFAVLTLVWLERAHNLEKSRRVLAVVHNLGKWSMLDVFVVAILIVAMKSAGVAEIHLGIGLYLFTFSVIGTQFASGWVASLLARS